MEKQEIKEQLESLKRIVEPLVFKNILNEIAFADFNFSPVYVLLNGEIRCGKVIASTKMFYLVEIDDERVWYPIQQVYYGEGNKQLKALLNAK